MTETSALLVLGNSVSLTQQLLPGLAGRDLFFSFGEDIPDLSGYDTVDYWCGGLFAMRLRLSGLAPHLSSPGTRWLCDLPEKYAGRQVKSGTLAALLAAEEPDRPLWVKPAEAKVGVLPAASYTPTQVREILLAGEIDEGVVLQWTAAHLDLDHEYRFFILDGEPVTGSPYKVGGRGWYPGMDTSRYDSALAFATEVAAEVPAPSGYTLDVAWDVRRECWLVVEANRAWSSGFYLTDPACALLAVHAACSPDPLWQWEPDIAVVREANSRRALNVLPLTTENAGFLRYAPAE